MEDTPLDGWNRPATAREKPPRVERAAAKTAGRRLTAPKATMTTELNRDAPLYEAELPVRLVGEDAAVVEGERQLTIRLLEGTRPLGSTETPLPNSSDGAAGRERLLHY